jgi:hypothetical protein
LHRLRLALAALCLVLLPTAPALAQSLPQAQTAAPAQSAAPSAAPLEALSGEYTNPVEPDTPLSFYVADGNFVV